MAGKRLWRFFQLAVKRKSKIAADFLSITVINPNKPRQREDVHELTSYSKVLLSRPITFIPSRLMIYSKT